MPEWGSEWDNQLLDLLILAASAAGFSGVFVYSPAPGPGNLIASVAAQAGTDPYGNAYVGGITSYSGSSTWAALTGAVLNLQTGGEFQAAQLGAVGAGVSFLSAGLATSGDIGAEVILASQEGSGSGESEITLSAQQTSLNSSATQAIPIAAVSGFPLPDDPNSGTTWVSGERAFMNNDWITPLNALYSALQAAGIIA
jgi:hypothetical protein